MSLVEAKEDKLQKSQRKLNLSIFSFFSGIGFLDLGFEDEGFKIEFVNEIHKPFFDAYQYSRKHIKMPLPKFGCYIDDIGIFLKGTRQDNLKDFVKKSRKIDNFVGFIGGPPCPDFSVGGKNRGRYGDNGRLSGTYVELICQQKPDFFLFENVKGLWRTARHRKFYEELKERLSKSGYVLTDRLINSIEYKAPQDRDRIILIGFKRSALSDLGLPTKNEIYKNGFFPWSKFISGPASKIFGLNWPQAELFAEDGKRTMPQGIIKDLTVQYWFDKNDVSNHPNSMQCFTPKAGLKKFLVVDEGDTSKKSYKRLHRWRYSPTACYGNNEVHLHPYKPRRITVAEALAIQSLPKNFILPEDMSLTDMFKSVGNGVPYLAARGLAKSIKSFLRLEQ